MNKKLQTAIANAFEIDALIAELDTQLAELIGDLKGAQRPHDAGMLRGVGLNLRDSFYRKLGGSLQDMQRQ